MARNLSWIDPEKLASLLDVVSPPSRPAHDSGEHPSDEPLESALFRATNAGEAAPQAPAAKAAPAPERDRAANQQAPANPPSSAAPASVAPASAAPASAAASARPAPASAAPASAAASARPAPVAVAPSAAPAPLASTPTPVAAVPVIATPAPVAAAPVPAARAVALPAAFQPSRDADLEARFEAFLDWVVSATQSRGALITDAHGFIVVARRASEVEPTMTTSVDLMLNHVADVVQSDLDGYVTFHRNGLHLVTLWTPTPNGRFFGVLIGETAPPQESIALAGQGLRTLFAN